MILGIISESQDARVVLVPDTVKQLIGLGVEVLIETGAGRDAGFADSLYAEAGAKIATSREDVLRQSGLLVTLHPISYEELSQLPSPSVCVSLFQPFAMAEVVPSLSKIEGFTAFSLDMIPRTTLAQAMDVLSSMASIAGYRAVLEAATQLTRYFPMLTTAAGTIPPAKVLVLGAGVAGLQAIATARRMGAVVEAFDTRLAAKEEVESLGAKFVMVEGATDSKDAGGYAVEQSEEYKARQRKLIQEKAAKADVIITTAQLRGKPAPLLITEDTVKVMRFGSVVVDLAASTGGNCAFTQDGRTITTPEGVRIVGNSNLAASVPTHASQLFSKNVFNFLRLLIKEGQYLPDFNDPIVRESCICKPTTAEVVS